MLGTAIIFSGGVLATQYSVGGSLEWGGRYFAMALPIAIPALLVGYRRCGVALLRSTARILSTAVIATSLAMSSLAAVSLRAQHRDNRRLAQTIVRLSGPMSGRPVVVSNVAWIARLEWDSYKGRDWLHVPRESFDTLSDRLRAAGRHEVTLATIGTSCGAQGFQGWHTVDRASLFANGRLWQVTTLRDEPGAGGCDVRVRGGG